MEVTGVIVVDDDLKILKLATSFLESEGIVVHCASSGEEALRLAREKPVTLMITDCHMPGMKGIELAGRIREIVPDMLILMISGDVSDETRSLAYEAGIHMVFKKPVRFGEILNSAKGAIRARNASLASE